MSNFVKVKCECGNEQEVFGSTTTPVVCLACKKSLATPTGGKAKVNAKIIEKLS